MSNIQACVFDLDGTLADTLPDLSFAVNVALKNNGFQVREEREILHFIGNGSNVLIQKSLGQEVSKEVFKKVFDDYMEYYLSHVDIKTKAYPGMKETLMALKEKGIKLFVLTNKPQKPAEKLIKTLFGSLFDEVVGNKPTLPTKPNPAGMNYLVSKYTLTPGKIVYLGDSDVDMLLADNADIIFKVACAYGYRPLKELVRQKPYFIIYKPKDILMLPCLH
jgi:phosphoglycolate phosphatase